MAIKLLPKSDIDKAKKENVRKDITEGLKIAGRVDNLREVHAQEEASLEKFRVETLSKIEREIVEKTAERDAIAQEVEFHKREKAEALKPILEEWERTKSAKADLKKFESELIDRESDLAQREKHVSKSEGALKDESQRIEEIRSRTAELLRSADNDKQASKAELESLQKARSDFESHKDITLRTLEQREQSIKATENRHAKRDVEQDARERELNDRETRIADRERTLERNLKRNG